MVSLVYLCVRPEQDAAGAEHRSFRRALGVTELDRIDLTTTPLPGRLGDRYDAVVVGGSPFNVVDEERSDVQRRVEADLEAVARESIEGDLAAFFTCYGIGVVTRMLGGTVGTAAPESPRPSRIRITDPTDPIFGPAAPEISVLSAHKEGSTEPPPDSALLATNEACPVQAYRVGEHLYATQFHPEATPSDFVERMSYYRTSGYFEPHEYERISDEVLATTVSGADLLQRFAQHVAGR